MRSRSASAPARGAQAPIRPLRAVEPGAPVTVVHVTDGRVHKVAVQVRRAHETTRDALLVLRVTPGTHAAVLPAAGATVSLVAGGMPFDTVVLGVVDDDVEVVLPEGMVVDERRRCTRVSVPASQAVAGVVGVRLPFDAAPRAARLVDLSATGARVLCERGDEALGDLLELHLDDVVAIVAVRRLVDHDHPLLCQLGVEFVDVPAELTSHILRTVGALRADRTNVL